MKHLPHLPTLLLPVLLLSVSVSTHGRRIVSRPMSTASAYAAADSASADTLPLTELGGILLREQSEAGKSPKWCSGQDGEKTR